MVNFDSEGLFTANKGEILNLIILGRRDELINTFKLWREKYISNDSGFKKLENTLRGSLFSIFLELKEPLERKLDKTEFKKLNESIYKTGEIKAEEIILCFTTINKFLDDINLIKIDTKKNYDSRILEDENFEKGL